MFYNRSVSRQACHWVLGRRATYISEASKDKFYVHASNVGGAHVCSVHEGHTVHGTNGDDETSVNATDNVSLFGLSEAKVFARARFGAQLASLVDMGSISPLLLQLIMATRLEVGRHGGIV